MTGMLGLVVGLIAGYLFGCVCGAAVVALTVQRRIDQDLELKSQQLRLERRRIVKHMQDLVHESESLRSFTAATTSETKH